MKKFLGVVLGLVAAMAIITVIEFVSAWLYPIAGELPNDDAAAMAAIVADMPLTAKLIVVTGWFLGSLGGAWLALRVADWRWAGWIIAAIVVAGGVASIVAIPHPLWMQICAVALPLVAGWMAARVHHKPYPGEPLFG